MAAPSHAFTIARAAAMLGESEELLWDLADQMEPAAAYGFMAQEKSRRSPSPTADWNIFRNSSESVTGPSDPRSIADGYDSS
jgi:hypothetical protein